MVLVIAAALFLWFFALIFPDIVLVSAILL